MEAIYNSMTVKLTYEEVWMKQNFNLFGGLVFDPVLESPLVCVRCCRGHISNHWLKTVIRSIHQGCTDETMKDLRYWRWESVWYFLTGKRLDYLACCPRCKLVMPYVDLLAFRIKNNVDPFIIEQDMVTPKNRILPYQVLARDTNDPNKNVLETYLDRYWSPLSERKEVQ